MRGLGRRGAWRAAEGNGQQAAGPAVAGDRRTRRRLLAGAAGVLGVAAAEVLGRAAPAQASAQTGTGSPVLLGTDNGYPTTRTSVFTSGQKEWAQLADPGNAGLGSLGIYAHGQDYGVYADAGSAGGTGVKGIGNGNGAGVIGTAGGDGNGVVGIGSDVATGVTGYGGSLGGAGVAGSGGSGGGPGVTGTGGGGQPGVQGYGGSPGGPGLAGQGDTTGPGVAGTGGPNGGTGVAGTGGSGNSHGVTGSASGSGSGVWGTAHGSGGTGARGTAGSASSVGVLAENTGGGTALQVSGPAVFSRSGALTVAAGKSSATQTGVALSSASLVLAVVQQNLSGVYVRAAVPNISGSSFTVYLSKAPTASANVAWFVVN